jgi:hypothetical protein
LSNSPLSDSPELNRPTPTPQKVADEVKRLHVGLKAFAHSSALNLPRTNQFLLSIYLLKLRSDQTDSVSVDLHQQRLSGDGRLLSFGHTCGRLRRRKIKSRHSRILRHRRQSATTGRSASNSKAATQAARGPSEMPHNWRATLQILETRRSLLAEDALASVTARVS